MTWCGCVCDVVEDVGDAVVGFVEDVVDAVADAAKDALETIGGWIEDAAKWIGEAAEDIAAFVEEVATKVWDWISETASDIWDWVKQVAGDVWEWTTGAMEDAWDWIREAVSDAWDWVANAAETVWDALVVAARAIADFVEEKVVPFLLDVLWVLTHIDEIAVGFFLGLACLIAGVDEKEYKVIEGMFRLDEDALANRSITFYPKTGNYVVFSDLHLFVAGDTLDKFRQIGNQELYKVVLASYYTSGHTLIENGDVEDLWMRETTLSEDLRELTFDVLGYPFGDILEEEYEDYRIRNQAIKIFENNSDVYQVIRNLFHDNQRYIRNIGNHDDAWRYNEYLSGLQIIYPGIKVYDYTFLGNYGQDHNTHGGNRPEVIISHGHQMDAWNSSICRTAGALITETGSGIPFLATNVTERNEWEEKLNGLGFDNELSESRFSIDEVEFYETIMKDFADQPYVPKFVLGHTHHALKDPLLPGYKEFQYTDIGRFTEYTNDGTAGRWEQFIWCATIENGVVTLHGWTWDSDGKPITYTFRGRGSNYLEATST